MKQINRNDFMEDLLTIFKIILLTCQLLSYMLCVLNISMIFSIITHIPIIVFMSIYVIQFMCWLVNKLINKIKAKKGE